MRKITPHLWFDKEAREAAAFYTSLFNGTIQQSSVLDNTPSGSVDIVTIDLAGMEFSLLSAGPLFKFTPAISFLVACETKEEVDALWTELSKGGTAMMELGAYPFSERYGWIQDRFGLSWQLMYAGGEPVRQKITPVLMFTGEQAGKAETAIDFYTSVFDGSKKDEVWRYEAGEEPEHPGTVKWAGFTLEGVGFGAMDSARAHGFGFNEAISIMVHCDTQEQIDYYWEKLSAVPAAEQCGWLEDRFGVAWQIVPSGMDAMLAGNDKARIARVTEAFLKMKKFDIAELQAAYDGA
jgi:predicted 3-demethylubiquinone-9 3-methyltransferase (glyoxalase superfamily)